MAENQKFAYVRVSSQEQNVGRQYEILKEYVENSDNYFTDKMSGKNFDRPNYQELKKRLRDGDILYFCSLDRMGRNYGEIKQEWQELTENKKVKIVILDMPILDMTRNVGKGLDCKFITDLVMQLLSYVAERERDNIRERQREGIALAKKIGIKFGRPEIPIPNNFNVYYQKITNGEITAIKAIEMMGLKKNTFYKFKKQYDMALLNNEY